MKKTTQFVVQILLLALLTSSMAWAQAVGDYGSLGTGNWGTTGANWVVCVTPGTWVGATAAGAAPTSAVNVWIRTGHSVTVEASPKNCANLTIETGAVLYSQQTTTTNRYVRVYGSTITTNGTFGDVADGLGIEPYASVTLTGTGTLRPCRVRPGANLSNATITIDQDMTLTYTGSSGTGGSGLYTFNSGTTDNISVIVHSGKTVTAVPNCNIATSSSTATDGAASSTFTIDGTLTLQGGILSLRIASGKTCNLTVNGTVDIGKDLIPTGTTGVASTIVVNGGGELKLTGSSRTAFFDNASQTVTGAGTFTLGSGNAITIGAAAGLDPTNGPIRTTTRNFSTGADYSYVGTAAQATGSDLPASVNNLTVINAAGVTLSQALNVTGTLTLTSGNFTLDGKTLTLGGALPVNVANLMVGSPSTLTVSVPGTYATIGEAIAATSPQASGINLAAQNFAENVVVNRKLTLSGVGATSIINPSSGIGVKVTANDVTLQSFKVTGTGNHGIYAGNVSNLTITSVEASSNTLSGVALQGVTGTSVLTNITATNNSKHGLEIGKNSSAVQVSGGTFTGNGTAGDLSTGGGIILYADAGTTTTGISIFGTVNASTNKTAGIYLYCDATGHINNTTIGATGTITLDDNGTDGGGGAAVVVSGPCDNTQIKANSTRSVAWQTAGLVVVGTDANGANSPTNTTAANCNLSGFSTTSPAGTMKVSNGTQTRISVNDVDATSGNLINGVATGFDVEDILKHKVDSLALGLFKGPGTELFVTPNSGSIQRAVDMASSYTVTQINVQDGTYAENVVVNKALVLNGQGANTIIKPSSGTAVDVTIAGVTLQNLNIYLTAPFTPTVAPTSTNNIFTFPVKVKVFMQGPYSGGTMSTALADANLIPTSQPYTVAPFSYAGSETAVDAGFFARQSITDWVLVELRSTSNGAAVDRRTAFLKNDGTVLGADSAEGVTFSVATAGDYYIVVNHRNHLAVMSAASVTLPNASAYDFTTALDQAFGTTTPMADLTGAFGMWSGDTDGNGVIALADKNNTWNDRNQTNVYQGTDTDLNGVVALADRNNTWNNRNKVGQVPASL